MAEHAQQKEFTGIDKHPGIVAIVFTLIVAGTFVGALANVYKHSHGHGTEHHAGDHTIGGSGGGEH